MVRAISKGARGSRTRSFSSMLMNAAPHNHKGDNDGAGKEDPPSLDEFSERLNAKREKPEAESPGGSGAAWGRAMRVSSELIAGVIVGGALGYGLDAWLETKPWFLLAGIFVGFAAGVRNLMRALKEDNNGSSEN